MLSVCLSLPAPTTPTTLTQSLVPPEEVVKHAQIEVQKLEAQAQAQAIAAVQVSAAAQRAEAEAQKHLAVHVHVAAQAQELQQKAVHLQVHAEQLTTTAAATDTVVVAASGVGMGMVATTISPALPGVQVGVSHGGGEGWSGDCGRAGECSKHLCMYAQPNVSTTAMPHMVVHCAACCLSCCRRLSC